MDLWSVSFVIEEKFKNLFSEYVEDFDGYVSSSLFVNENIYEKDCSVFLLTTKNNNNLGEFYQNQFWVLEVLLDQKPLDHIIKIRLNNLAKELKINQYEIHNYRLNNEVLTNTIWINKIVQKDWLKHNRKSFPIINIDKFYIYGSHITKDCPHNKIPIKIDASIAFGTGSHATTKSCLKAITHLSKFFTPKKVLDYGCGTGILGIASKKIFKKSIITFADIDKNAVKLTKENLKFNNIKSNKIYLTNQYYFKKYIKINFYDLVFANILFAPMYNLAPTFRFILKPCSFIIISGLLKAQVPYIINRYNNFGFKEYKMIMLDSWGTVTMTLKK